MPHFKIDITPSIFKLERRSKAQNVGNSHGYLIDATIPSDTNDEKNRPGLKVSSI